MEWTHGQTHDAKTISLRPRRGRGGGGLGGDNKKKKKYCCDCIGLKQMKQEYLSHKYEYRYPLYKQPLLASELTNFDGFS